MLYLFKRILDPSEVYVNDDYRTTELEKLIQVAKVLITPQSCIAFSLEELMGIPDCPDEHTVPYCGKCTNCTQKKYPFESISREGVTKILFDLFISSSDDMVFTMDNTVTYIREYPDSQQLIFGTSRKKFEHLRIKKVLFQLITFRIITVVFSVRMKCVLFQLARVRNSALELSINIDTAWEDIPLIADYNSTDDVQFEDGLIDDDNNTVANSVVNSDQSSDIKCDLMV